MKKKYETFLKEEFERACKVLKVNSSDIELKFEGIGNRFKTKYNSSELVGNILYINTAWVDAALENNDKYDLKFIMYHEARHLYQSQQIDAFINGGTLKENIATIKEWMQENGNYRRNDGKKVSMQRNQIQRIEIEPVGGIKKMKKYA